MMFDFTAQEKRTGRCRCGQELWTMPMFDCDRKAHHDPGMIPSNPDSPFHAQWIRGNRQRLEDTVPNEEIVDPLEGESRNRILALIREGGIGEATHLEAFISALNGITPVEHAEAAQWLRNRRLGITVGPPPPGITKMGDIVTVDDRFWQIADDYHMHDTPFRLTFLMDMAQRLLEYHAKNAGGTR